MDSGCRYEGAHQKRSAWDLNPSLADDYCTSRLRGLLKVDGSLSVSRRPAEESEMERAELKKLQPSKRLTCWCKSG